MLLPGITVYDVDVAKVLGAYLEVNISVEMEA